MEEITDIQYLESILKPIIMYPDLLGVMRQVDEMGVLLTVSIAKDDMGRIIGKNGETARSIRRLIRQYGIKNNCRLSMKVNEPE